MLAVSMPNFSTSAAFVDTATKCFATHRRQVVEPANADVDDTANTLAGVSFPLSVTNPVGEVRHLVEHGMNLRNDVLAVDQDRSSLGCPQGHMQDRALLGGVDLI